MQTVGIENNVERERAVALKSALQQALSVGNCNGCYVILSEEQQSPQLIVTIVKPNETMMALGWTGPTKHDDEFHYTRRFEDDQVTEMVRYARAMWNASAV